MSSPSDETTVASRTPGTRSTKFETSQLRLRASALSCCIIVPSSCTPGAPGSRGGAGRGFLARLTAPLALRVAGEQLVHAVRAHGVGLGVGRVGGDRRVVAEVLAGHAGGQRRGSSKAPSSAPGGGRRRRVVGDRWRRVVRRRSYASGGSYVGVSNVVGPRAGPRHGGGASYAGGSVVDAAAAAQARRRGRRVVGGARSGRLVRGLVERRVRTVRSSTGATGSTAHGHGRGSRRR